MSKFKLSLMLVIMTAISMPAMAGEKVVKRVPTGAVAFHFVLDLNYLTGDLVGYVAFIEGVDRPLFTGDPSEDTAYFNVRLTKLVDDLLSSESLPAHRNPLPWPARD